MKSLKHSLCPVGFCAFSAVVMGCGGQTTGINGAGNGGTPPVGGAGTTGSTVTFGGATPITSVIPPRLPESHRVEAASCVGVNAPPEPTYIPNPQMSRCTKHADCADGGVSGKCVNGVGMAGSIYSCVYDTCATDADCSPGMVCYCSSTQAARCFSVGNCRTDADCGTSAYAYCSPSMSWDCGGYRPVDGYHCHTPQDSCMDDSDCAGSDYCNFNEYEGRWKCTATNTSCVIG